MAEKTHTHIEDALADGSPAVDPVRVLEDDQLREGGLVPVRTWVRTKASANALRAKKSREKAEKGEGGAARKQISLLAPPDDDARKALRQLGKRMVDGEVSTEDLQAIGSAPMTVDHHEATIGRRALSLIKSGGFRGRLIQYLLR